jgi:hypothetical protein
MGSLTETAAATPTAMLAEVRATREASVLAESRLLVLATEWADAHPVLPEDPEPFAAIDPQDPAAEWARELDAERGIPGWSWRAGASFAAAVGRSTAGGDAMIRDALILRHRLPRVWARVVACEVEAWRARRIAQAVLGQPDDVCAHLDDELDDVAHRVGPVILDRLLDEALLRLHPEERELAQLEALDRRHATLHPESINDTGVADMSLRGDWKDLHDFDQALARVAAALARADEQAGSHADTLDVRRARAVGVLADPASALALLEGRSAPKPSKHTTLFLHISDLAVLGLDPVGRNETANRAMLDQQIRDWCGRTDSHVSVQPVIDLNDHVRTDAYEVRGRFETRNHLLHSMCVFPLCTRPARQCDHDHRVPRNRGGETCDCNIAPLCRRHHRLKTHAGWRYTLIEPGVWLWSDTHGQQFIRDDTGTLDVTPRERRVSGRSPDHGCRAGP